jgi:LacI family transcriptional regulator
MLNLQYLTSRSVDGLIISVSAETKDFSYFKELHDRGMPIVFFDRIVDEIATHKVIVDNYKGAYEATVHLINSGYKRIATLSNAPVLSIARERLAGYRAALADNEMDADEKLIKYCQHGGMIVEEVEEAVDQLLQLSPRPDAILASADKLTTNCLRILKARGLSVPDDMGLVGFSNTDLTELLDPPLSVIRQPAFEMGEVAITQLLHLIESKRPVTDFETRVLTTELLIRGSTKKGKKKKELA